VYALNETKPIPNQIQSFVKVEKNGTNWQINVDTDKITTQFVGIQAFYI